MSNMITLCEITLRQSNLKPTLDPKIKMESRSVSFTESHFMLNLSRQNWSLCLGKRRRNGSVAACKTNHPAVQYTIWHLPLWDGKGGGSYLHCWSAIFILSCDSSRDNQITYSWHSYRYVFMMSVTTMKKIDDDPVQCPTLCPPRNAGAANLRYPSALQQHF